MGYFFSTGRSLVFVQIIFWEVLSSQFRETLKTKVAHLYRSTRPFRIFHLVRVDGMHGL